MNGRRTATDRLQRLLALVPWVAARPEGVPVDEVCARFRISRTELLADIDTLMMTGIHPFTPDMMTEAMVDDDLVTIRYADEFARPLRLTAEEAVVLMTAARGVSGIPGREADGPLERAVAKLRAVLPGGEAGDIAVDLGRAGGEVFAVLEDGLTDRTIVEIDYPDIDDASVRTRRVEPAAVFSSAGRWYLSGWCHHADGPRVFRVDRILDARPTGQPFTAEPVATDPVIDFDPALPGVTLQVDRSAAWLLDRVPVLDRVEGDRTVEVSLAVASPSWLARFLLRLGPAGRVVRSDPGLDPHKGVRVEAQRILARYE